MQRNWTWSQKGLGEKEFESKWIVWEGEVGAGREIGLVVLWGVMADLMKRIWLQGGGLWTGSAFREDFLVYSAFPALRSAYLT